MKKIAFCLLTAAIYGAVVRPSLAKTHHAHRAGVAAKTGGTVSKGVKPSGAPGKASDRGMPGADEANAPPVPHQPPLDRAHNGSTNVRIVPPGKPAPHSPASPIVVRNAIGQPVVAHGSALPNNPHPPAAMMAAPKAMTNPTNAFGHPAGAPPSHPLATAGVSSRSTIDGANLARPGHALTTLGGPAKPATGIDGTTMRVKH